MKFVKHSKHLSLSIALIIVYSLGFSQVQVTKPVCEYKENPVGIDVKKPRLSWQLLSDKQDVMQTAYEIRVADSPKNLANKSKQIWATGKVTGSESVNVEYGGPEPEPMQRFYWQVRVWDNYEKESKWSEPAFWEMGILDPKEWTASWISMPKEVKSEDSKPAQYFRKVFTSEKRIKSARVYVTSKGTYQLFINGKKVSADLFAPGWTTYNKRIQYQTYDVTSMLQQKNAIGAMVGDGWFRGTIARNLLYGDKLALLAQLQIDYVDGTSELVTTDNSWKVSTGPILQSDLYNGETYDARLEMQGWNEAGFDDSKWHSTVEVNDSKDILVAQCGVPVRAIQEIKPVKLLKTPKGEVVFDMGQNMVGWVRLKVNGNKGDKVILKFAEVLDKEGNFYVENLRAAKCTDVYILKGGGEEIYEPYFTFHGFRFVKIEGLDKMPDLNQITGVVIHSEMTPTGTFVCSDSLINQLQHNIQWGQKGNFLDVPTDCPQRDERLGWTGDAQVFSPTAAFNYDVAAFYTKWLRDLAADQLPDGKVPDVVPDVRFGRGGATAWADAALVVPWNTYLVYGDKRILEEQYSSMKGWVDYMTSRAGDDFLWTGDKHYGDWLAFATTSSSYPGATTEKDLIATAYYKYSSGLLSEIAEILGKKVDAEKYAKLSENIKKAFQHEFVTSGGRLISHTQTAYSLALTFNLLSEDLIPKAAKYLADDVKKMGHLTTGFVGTPLLCESLSANGYEDLAYMLLNRKEYPSWLYPVTQGATTIWERWDGQKPDGTFQSVSMNSFNHYAYGAIGEWMYTYIAGIKIDEKNPGYKHFYLNPHPGGGLTNAKAEHLSMYGKISSSWKIEGQSTVYDFEIPPNTTATIILPGENSPRELGSGRYTFTVR
ncbi:MAG: glycoside hydrolase family 78 protein [Draconibacterium sp.]